MTCFDLSPVHGTYLAAPLSKRECRRNKGNADSNHFLQELVLRSRILLVLSLGKAAAPGIPGLQFSFVREPELDFQLRAVGLTVTQIPGVLSQLKQALLRVIMNEAVEPARVWVNLQRPFDNLVTSKQAGPCGQLRVRPFTPIQILFPSVLFPVLCSLSLVAEPSFVPRCLVLCSLFSVPRC